MKENKTAAVIRSASDRVTKFERVVVFRVARGYFLLMAFTAVLVFAGGVVLMALSTTKTEVPRPQLPAPPPPRAALSYEFLKQQLDANEQARLAAGQTDQYVPYVGSGDGSAAGSRPQPIDELAVARAQFRSLFPNPPYLWDNEMERVCVTNTRHGCLQWRTQVKNYGVSEPLERSLRNISQSELLGYLRVLNQILALLPEICSSCSFKFDIGAG